MVWGAIPWHFVYCYKTTILVVKCPRLPYRCAFGVAPSPVVVYLDAVDAVDHPVDTICLIRSPLPQVSLDLEDA